MLFPQARTSAGAPATYIIQGPLYFRNAGQRCIFLGGTQLELQSDTAVISITAPSQIFEGLAIHGGTVKVQNRYGLPAQPNPCLLIDGASNLLMKDLYVDCGGATTFVRIQNTEGVTIEAGEISGHLTDGQIGLEIANGVVGFRAISLAVIHLQHGVLFTGTSRSIAFVDSTIEDETEDMIEVQGHVYGLNLTGVHMESTDSGGAHHCIVVQSTGGVHGGVFTGCDFDSLSATDSLGVPVPRRVFIIAGQWTGCNVFGCYHHGDADEDATLHAIYELQPGSQVSQSGDTFNAWKLMPVIATGDNVRHLATFDGDSGALHIASLGISLDAGKLGFFGATPTERPAKYLVPNYDARNLQVNGAYKVLATLLRDLGNLGLIQCA